MGQNPTRTPDDQQSHDIMVRIVANDLDQKGYFVQADHIGWKNGPPNALNGHVPDVVAKTESGKFILEIEDGNTYKDQYTKEQLAAYIKDSTDICYVVVPSPITKPEVEQVLNQSGLFRVKVGIFDWNLGQVIF
jgi:hypothetical protein